jgi:CheY-like chemotaxis protein
MRKVLEITFAGEDFRVLTADSASSALAQMSDDPAAAVVDLTLGADDGYVLAKEMRARNARLAIVLMASRYNPYDANRGRDAGVDDFVDKPFDTQTLIDKVKKAVVTRELARAATPAPAPVAARVPAAAPAPAAAAIPPSLVTTTPFGSQRIPTPAGVQPVPTPAAVPAGAARPGWAAQRTHTLSFEGGVPIAPPPAASPVVPPVRPTPMGVTPPSRIAGLPTAGSTSRAAAPAGPAPTSPVSSAHALPTAPPRADAGALMSPAAPNGQLATKLDELGLTAAQVDAVLALSRELVERVVWEVVPQLAETIIKEEIARLTQEG